jgi:ABC-type dipeptide/oligopeptide/nickel transport system ATPase subunit
MLNAEGIVRCLGTRAVLNGATICLPPGAVIGLGGASGAGKSVLARILSGRDSADAGRVTLDGQPRPVSRPGQPAPVQHAPQSATLAIDPRWRIADVLANAGPPDRVALDALGIARAWADRHAAELSGGELARVSLARLFHPGLRFLICDEITAELDALAQASLWDGLLALTRARQIGVLMISHDADLRRARCARSHLLEDGHIRPEKGDHELIPDSGTGGYHPRSHAWDR